jgi:hypothetical protein
MDELLFTLSETDFDENISQLSDFDDDLEDIINTEQYEH